MAGRWPGFLHKLTSRPWGTPVARDIEEMFRKLMKGMGQLQQAPDTPTTVQAGVVADPGDGSAVAFDDHVHAIETGIPPNPTGQVAAEGTGTALMRAGATIKQGIVTTKGDLLTHHATLPERLAVGANTRLLMADSTQVTGLKWADQSELSDAGGGWARHFLLSGME